MLFKNWIQGLTEEQEVENLIESAKDLESQLKETNSRLKNAKLANFELETRYYYIWLKNARLYNFEWQISQFFI